MAVIKLTDMAVRRLRRLPMLQGKKRIGKGHFSIVFEDTPDTVIKVTTDQAHHAMLTNESYGLRGDHFPRVVEDFGRMEEKIVFGQGIPLFLVRMERLDKLQRGTEQARLATKLCRAAMNSHGSNIMKATSVETISKSMINDVAKHDWVPDSVRGALDELHDFCTYCPNAKLDFHFANFMTRPATGELVLADPIYDSSLHNHSLRFSYAY